MESKIKGGLYGVAVGDALGVSTEFMTPEQIREKYGKVTDIIGGGVLDAFQAGEWSDDTDMTLCVTRGIAKQPNNPIPTIGDAFAAWMATKPRDAGNTVRYAYTLYKMYGNWEDATRAAHDMLHEKTDGNGTLMRTLPVALAYKDISLVERYSQEQSKLTHYGERAAEACWIYNQIAIRLLNEELMENAILSVIRNTSYAELIRSQNSFYPDEHVEHTLAWALIVLLHTKSFENALVSAVNMGYDSDTLAAVVGGLAGVHYGYESIPKRWVSALIRGSEIEEASRLLQGVRNSLQ